MPQYAWRVQAHGIRHDAVLDVVQRGSLLPRCCRLPWSAARAPMVLPRSALLQRAQNSCVTRGESLTIFTSDGWVWCRVDPLGGGVSRKPTQQRTSIQPRRSYCPRALHCGSLGVSAAVLLMSRYMGPAARYDDFEAVVGCPSFWLLIAQIL